MTDLQQAASTSFADVETSIVAMTDHGHAYDSSTMAAIKRLHWPAQVGISLANPSLNVAASRTPSLLAVSLLGLALASPHDWYAGRPAAQTSGTVVPSNPPELSAAA